MSYKIDDALSRYGWKLEKGIRYYKISQIWLRLFSKLKKNDFFNNILSKESLKYLQKQLPCIQFTLG